MAEAPPNAAPAVAVAVRRMFIPHHPVPISAVRYFRVACMASSGAAAVIKKVRRFMANWTRLPDDTVNVRVSNKMKSIKLLSAILLGAVLLCAEPPASTNAKKSSSPGFDIGAMDRSVDPCTDFYTYACGTWMKNNPIPADKAIWGRFDELRERNLTELRNILEQSPAGTQIGDAYAACMDEKGIESKGIAPIQPSLDRIAALKDKQAVMAEIAHLHSQGYRMLFGFGSTQDFKDSSQVIAEVDQGGMGMPDRDYYLKDDARSVGLRKQYQEHVARMFGLLGDRTEVAAAKAKVVMEIETESRFTLIYGNRTKESTMFRAELDRLESRYADRLEIRHVLSAEPRHTPELSGRIDTERLTRWLTGDLHPDSVDEWFLCGPAAMSTGARETLIQGGVDPERIHLELFTGFDRGDSPARDHQSATVTVQLSGKRQAFGLAGGDTILESALQAGIGAPYSCMGGACGTCRAKLLGGTVEMDQNFTLGRTDLDAGYILTCQSHPTSPTVSVDYDA